MPTPSRYPRQTRQPRPQSPKTSWEPIADWYGKHLSQAGTFHETIIFPNTFRLLNPKPHHTYLDLACGEGSFCRYILKQVDTNLIGLDASAQLIKQASQATRAKNTRFITGDATRFATEFNPASIDGMSCMLAIQNINPLAPVLRDAATVLKPGGCFVLVMNHPAFRQPRQSGWGWDEERKLQYRRIDAYLTSYEMPIIAHPGSKPSVKTYSYHRPLSEYVQELARHGFVVDALEEWISDKNSDSGPRAKAENVARQEFPLFLAIRARKLPVG